MATHIDEAETDATETDALADEEVAAAAAPAPPPAEEGESKAADGAGEAKEVEAEEATASAAAVDAEAAGGEAAGAAEEGDSQPAAEEDAGEAKEGEAKEGEAKEGEAGAVEAEAAEAAAVPAAPTAEQVQACAARRDALRAEHTAYAASHPELRVVLSHYVATLVAPPKAAEGEGKDGEGGEVCADTAPGVREAAVAFVGKVLEAAPEDVWAFAAEQFGVSVPAAGGGDGGEEGNKASEVAEGKAADEELKAPDGDEGTPGVGAWT